MAYTHSKYEVYGFSTTGVASMDQDLTSTGDKFLWEPGYVPHYIRAVMAVITTATVGTAAVVDFDKRITAGSDTGRVSSGGVARLNIPAKSAGTVIYKDGLNSLITPGQQVVFKVTTAVGTCGKAAVLMLFEPSCVDTRHDTVISAPT